jgi:hypothetical protein
MSDDKAEEIKKNILSPSQWIRILYMAFYAIACWALVFILPVVIVCQIIISLITGADNKNLRDFGKTLSDYFHQAMDYLVYAADEKPWPFSDGEDLGDTYSHDATIDDIDDDLDDDESKDYTGDKEEVSRRPSAAHSGDDVFSDISFTGDQEQTPAPDNSVDFDDADNSTETGKAGDVDSDFNKKDPA